jgi:lipopolysaccharide/colanic/teichoic acid biosynthesis glycosyltransferase
MVLNIIEPKPLLYRIRYRHVKHWIDLAICLIALPFVVPVMIVCAIAIFLDSPGPVLFIQERVGKNGRRFQMFKFRTMQTNFDTTSHKVFMRAFVLGEVGNDENPETPNHAKDSTTIYKPVQASQTTRVGGFLRKTSLDELPQLINVFKGEMSLVGPRPNVPWEVEAYKLWHSERFEVLPGITGLAQIEGRSSISFSRIVKSDIEYIEKQSLELDLAILLTTIWRVCSRQGAH